MSKTYQLVPFGLLFEFARDANQLPKKDGVVLRAGADWMRLHFPKQWAAFVAARLERRTAVPVVKHFWWGFTMLDRVAKESQRIQAQGRKP